MREDCVGDAYFIEISVGGERIECCMLCFPTETTDPRAAVIASLAIAARPLTPSGFDAVAFAKIKESGIASMRPAPNSGVVIQFATMFASEGTFSRYFGAMARFCNKGPPRASSGS